MKLLLYCTQAEPNLYIPYEQDWFEEDEASNVYLASEPIIEEIDIKANGTVIAECDCDKVEMYDMEYHGNDAVLQTIHLIRPDFEEFDEEWWERELICTNENLQTISDCKLLKNARLSFDQLGKYVCKDGYGVFCAIYLKKLRLFDAPKQLSDYGLIKAPQNMRYCIDENGNKCILISVRSMHMYDILNSYKSIEIRRMILKKLKELIK